MIKQQQQNTQVSQESVGFVIKSNNVDFLRLKKIQLDLTKVFFEIIETTLQSQLMNSLNSRQEQTCVFLRASWRVRVQ